MTDGDTPPKDRGAVEAEPRGWPTAKWTRLVVLLAGIVVCQAILYGPCLIGRKILLPLDILATPATYLPMTPAVAKMVPHNPVLSDLVYQFEPERRFAVAEIKAGRFPMWAPYEYTGVPTVWPRFSVFQLPGLLISSPVVLAWIQLLEALVAGVGAYVFFRRALRLSFWAAVIPAWCYPMTGFFVFWQGYPTCAAVYWMPWLLLAVDKTVRQTTPSALAGLGVVTTLVLTSGHIDVAGQLLLASGLYALWCWWDTYHGQWFQRAAGAAILRLAIGWSAGFLIAAPHLLPLVEYAKTGARMIRRSAGKEERPPVGLVALPQVILPHIYGSTETDSLPLFPRKEHNLLESTSAAYAGILATLLVAPLAWCSRRHYRMNWFWLLLGCAGLSWCLNVPGIVALLRLPGLNMMSHNRLTFWTAFAILALAAIGLEAVLRGQVKWRRWFWILALLLTGLAIWCGERTVTMPRAVMAEGDSLIEVSKTVGWIRNTADVQRVATWFYRTSLIATVLCGLGVGGWFCLRAKNVSPGRIAGLFGVLMVADLLSFAYGHSSQCDPALYYPPLPALTAIRQMPPGRVVGYGCLPPTLAETQGLNDVRGYDSVDPARLLDLLAIAAKPGSVVYSFARSAGFVPQSHLSPPDWIQLSPVLDMLDVRYVIFRGQPPPDIHPPIQYPDYWVLENRAALPRSFFPHHVETVTSDVECLRKLKSPDFDPREVAYVDGAVNLPEQCRGTVEIIREIPTRVTLSVQAETPGLVVLADLWNKGWRAYLNGKPVPILRTNYALRGVEVPAGKATLEFRYQPASLVIGLSLAAAGLVVLLCSVVVLRGRQTAGVAARAAIHSGDAAAL